MVYVLHFYSHHQSKTLIRLLATKGIMTKGHNTYGHNTVSFHCKTNVCPELKPLLLTTLLHVIAWVLCPHMVAQWMEI